MRGLSAPARSRGILAASTNSTSHPVGVPGAFRRNAAAIRRRACRKAAGNPFRRSEASPDLSTRSQNRGPGLRETWWKLLARIARCALAYPTVARDDVWGVKRNVTAQVAAALQNIEAIRPAVGASGVYEWQRQAEDTEELIAILPPRGTVRWRSHCRARDIDPDTGRNTILGCFPLRHIPSASGASAVRFRA